MATTTRLIKLGGSLVAFGISTVRKRCCAFLGRPVQGVFVVLYYHSVPPGQRRRFVRQMKDLTRWAKPVHCDGARLAPGVHHVAVTFDDGFRSVFENAIPEMVKRGIPSTIFIPSGHIGASARWFGEESGQVIMSADEVRKVASELTWIGSHTVNHSKLLALNEDQARRELSLSKQQLEELLGRDVALFSFPYGEYNERLVHWCREAGYECVFTTVPTALVPRPGQYVQGRVSVDPGDWRLEFRLKVAGAYCWLEGAAALKRWLRSRCAVFGLRVRGRLPSQLERV